MQEENNMNNPLDDLCAEKAPFSFDIDKLRDWYDTYLKPLEPKMIGPQKNWGGWGVWTSTGDWRDGFVLGRRQQAESGILEAQPGFQNSFGQRVPTELCKGYMEEVMKTIWDLNLRQSRVRCAKLPPGNSMQWHRDLDADIYMVRLHVPIYTNPGAVFSIKDEKTGEEFSKHLPADGSAYFVSTNVMHLAANNGPEDRVHLIMDVLDTDISRQHSWPAFLKRCRANGMVARKGASKI
jgi:hypothetical protein